MAGEINSSFIPKKEVRARQHKKLPLATNVFLLIGVVVFLTSLLAALGIFMWDRQLDSSNARALATLEKNRDNYGVDAVAEYINLNNRIKAADQLLSNHVDVVKIFTILEEDTLVDVYLKDFGFTTVENAVNVTAQGYAPTYTHVALQADQYGANNLIKDLLLSDVNQDREGGISFKLTFSVDRGVFIVNN